MCAPSRALAALKIAVAGGSATLARLEFVGIHGQAHGTARLAPLKTGGAEDAIKAAVNDYRQKHNLASAH